LPEPEGTATQSRDAPASSDWAVDAEQACLHLTILWSRHEPHRVGECCAISRHVLLGRGADLSPNDPPKVEFGRARPGQNVPTGTLDAPTLSRRQLRLSPTATSVHVENLGRPALLHNGVVTRECQAKPGDTLAIDGVLLLAVSERPRVIPSFDYAPFAFGAPDEDGLLGETVAIWELRRDLVTLSKSRAHTFIMGESGVGKELCARAIHRRSTRGRLPLVSRSAATIPASLVEAELFGQARHYPNAGSPARKGLLGLAHQSTLFLDEIGELGEREQANLLRVLDSGEYQSLGEDQLRRSDVRMLVATNQPPECMKVDVLARFPERLTVPSLNARQGDVPLLVRHILQQLVTDGTLGEAPEPALELIDVLCRHRYTLHFRELERLVRVALKHCKRGTLPLTDELLKQLTLAAPPIALDPERVRDTLRHARTSTEAANRLGLSNRYALYRALKRLGMDDAKIGE
jgi:transcriptional regulator with AAA-type ATPase domain